MEPVIYRLTPRSTEETLSALAVDECYQRTARLLESAPPDVRGKCIDGMKAVIGLATEVQINGLRRGQLARLTEEHPILQGPPTKSGR